MSCLCCTQTLFLGCFTHCQDVIFPFVALQTGTYFILWELNGNTVTIEKYILAGDTIDFNGRFFNENHLIKAQIIQPDGFPLEYIAPNGVTYDCFSFDITVGNNFVAPSTINPYYA